MRPGREVLYASAMSAYQSYQVVHGPAFDPSGPGTPEFARTPTRYWYRYDVGPARFFVLDTRNERYLSLAGADPQIISSDQMSALLQWLVESPPDAPKFVVTSVPMFPDDRSEISDKWAGFPAAAPSAPGGDPRPRHAQGRVPLRRRPLLGMVGAAAARATRASASTRSSRRPSSSRARGSGQADRFDLRGTIANPPARLRHRRPRADPRRRRLHARLA